MAAYSIGMVEGINCLTLDYNHNPGCSIKCHFKVLNAYITIQYNIELLSYKRFNNCSIANVNDVI